MASDVTKTTKSAGACAASPGSSGEADTHTPGGKSLMTKYEVQHHLGNPKLCRVNGLKLKPLSECEGGGWATDERTAQTIAAALNASDKPSAQTKELDVDVLMHKAEVLADKYQYLLPSDNDSIRLAKEIKALITEAANA